MTPPIALQAGVAHQGGEAPGAQQTLAQMGVAVAAAAHREVGVVEVPHLHPPQAQLGVQLTHKGSGLVKTVDQA